MRTILLTCILAATASAQSSFYADLDGGQEAPTPVVTDAAGWGRFTLNPDRSVTYEVRNWKVSGTVAHIHVGAFGVAGAIIKPLVGGPNVWSGTTTPLTVAQATTFRSSGMYVNVHSLANPGGEVRGQIDPRPLRFVSLLNGAQEFPTPTSTGATGTGEFMVTLGASDDLAYSVTSDAVSVTASHLHDGIAGASGGIAFVLTGGPPTFSGTIAGLDPSEFTQLQEDGYYTNIHTIGYAAGEIRGQVIPDGIKYADVPTAPVDLDIVGQPQDCGTISLNISNGVPDSIGFLYASLGPGGGTVKGKPFVLDATMLVLSDLLLPLDGTGSLSLPTTLDPGLIGIDIFFQFFNTPGGPISASNGVRLPFKALPCS